MLSKTVCAILKTDFRLVKVRLPFSGHPRMTLLLFRRKYTYIKYSSQLFAISVANHTPKSPILMYRGDDSKRMHALYLKRRLC